MAGDPARSRWPRRLNGCSRLLAGPFEVAEWLNLKHRTGKIPLLGNGIEIAPASNPQMVQVVARISVSGESLLEVHVQNGWVPEWGQSFPLFTFGRARLEASLEAHLKREAEDRTYKDAAVVTAAAVERKAAQKREAEERARKEAEASSAAAAESEHVKSRRKPGPGAERTYDHCAIVAAAERVLARGRPDLKQVFFDQVRAEMPKGTKMPPRDHPTLDSICGALLGKKSQ
jgi:hypothetical protein